MITNLNILHALKSKFKTFCHLFQSDLPLFCFWCTVKNNTPTTLTMNDIFIFVFFFYLDTVRSSPSGSHVFSSSDTKLLKQTSPWNRWTLPLAANCDKQKTQQGVQLEMQRLTVNSINHGVVVLQLAVLLFAYLPRPSLQRMVEVKVDTWCWFCADVHFSLSISNTVSDPWSWLLRPK